MSVYLPPEVVMEIMMRLPVEAILRCTCVCKSWYSLITNPTFITTHLNRSMANNNPPHLLLRRCLRDYSTQPGAFSINENYIIHSDNHTFDVSSANDTPPFDSSMRYYRIIGISNGLLCLSNDNLHGTHFTFLWNPHIRKFLQIPTPTVTYHSHVPYEHSMGFFFTPSTNDYKIVRLVYHDCGKVPPEAELYELSTGCWRKINAANLSYVIHYRNPQAFLNGAIHWFGFEACTRFQRIVSFDIENEVFGLMVMPTGVARSWWSSRVAIYQDSLSLSNHVQDHNGDYCSIWVMREYGKAESWTKQFTIDLKQGNFRMPFGFGRNGNVLLPTERGDLVSYDPNTRQTKYLGIHGYVHPFEADTFFADTFVESLVLLGRGNFSGGASIVPEEDGEVRNQT